MLSVVFKHIWENQPILRFHQNDLKLVLARENSYWTIYMAEDGKMICVPPGKDMGVRFKVK